MSVTSIVPKTAGSAGFNSTGGTTASVTLTLGKKYYLTIVNIISGASTSNVPTVPGWSEVPNSAISDSLNRNTWVSRIFEKDGDGSTGTHSIDFGGQQQGGIDWLMTEVSGDGAVWSNVQAVRAQGTNSAPTVTMAALSNPTGNAVLTFAVGYTFSPLFVPPNYTQLTWAFANLSASAAYKIGVSGADLIPAFEDPADDWTCQGIEIQHVAGGPAPAPADPDPSEFPPDRMRAFLDF